MHRSRDIFLAGPHEAGTKLPLNIKKIKKFLIFFSRGDCQYKNINYFFEKIF